MKILNLTQHLASQEQIEEGVVEPKNKDFVKELLTFDELPTKEEIQKRATELTKIAMNEGYKKVMIGGAPYLMGMLELTLKSQGIQSVYAFSKRVSIEKDGVKTSVFKHIGFVEV